MSLSIHLHAGDWADYEWGTLVPTFRSTARVHEKTLLDTLQSLYYHVGPWKTELEFRRTIAFMHEFVHFGQDLFTGVGCWDYLVQQKYLPKVLGDAYFLSRVRVNKVPFVRTEDVESDYEEIVFQTQPGDAIVLYSDGVPDQLNRRGEDYTRARLSKVLRASCYLPPQGITEKIFQDLDKFSAGADAFDDQTQLVMKVK